MTAEGLKYHGKIMDNALYGIQVRRFKIHYVWQDNIFFKKN